MTNFSLITFVVELWDFKNYWVGYIDSFFHLRTTWFLIYYKWSLHNKIKASFAPSCLPNSSATLCISMNNLRELPDWQGVITTRSSKTWRTMVERGKRDAIVAIVQQFHWRRVTVFSGNGGTDLCTVTFSRWRSWILTSESLLLKLGSHGAHMLLSLTAQRLLAPGPVALGV